MHHSGVGEHFQVLKVSEGTCAVLCTYLPTVGIAYGLLLLAVDLGVCQVLPQEAIERDYPAASPAKFSRVDGYSPQGGVISRTRSSIYIYIYTHIYIYMAPFDTNNAFYLLWITMNGILINKNAICIWIGTPKPHSQRFRLAASNFVSQKRN